MKVRFNEGPLQRRSASMKVRFDKGLLHHLNTQATELARIAYPVRKKFFLKYVKGFEEGILNGFFSKGPVILYLVSKAFDVLLLFSA